MKKVLVIVAHPDIAHSVVSKRWVEALKRQPQRFTVHELYKVYPDGNIDVKQEQALVEQHAHVVWQFPVYWFNCPPLLKRWLDEVLTHGWAFGSKGKAFQMKKLGIAVSLGAPAQNYTRDGDVGYTVTEVLRAFELVANYVGASYQPLFAFHTIDSYESYSEEVLRLVDEGTQAYLAHLNKYFP